MTEQEIDDLIARTEDVIRKHPDIDWDLLWWAKVIGELYRHDLEQVPEGGMSELQGLYHQGLIIINMAFELDRLFQRFMTYIRSVNAALLSKSPGKPPLPWGEMRDALKQKLEQET